MDSPLRVDGPSVEWLGSGDCGVECDSVADGSREA